MTQSRIARIAAAYLAEIPAAAKCAGHTASYIAIAVLVWLGVSVSMFVGHEVAHVLFNRI